MNYNVVLWLSGFLAGLGVGIGCASIICRLLPLKLEIKSAADVHLQLDPPEDDADSWKRN